MGQAMEPVLPELVGHISVGEPGAGLGGHARPGDAVGRLVIAVIAHRGHEQLPHRVPDHSRGRVAVRRRKRIERALHVLPPPSVMVARCHVAPLSEE